MELRMHLDDDFVEELQRKMGGKIKATEIVRDSLTMFNWAVDELSAKRVVGSSDVFGEEMHKLVMPIFALIQATAAARAAEALEEEKARQNGKPSGKSARGAR